MIPTNYHLFDFLDFSEDFHNAEQLWTACRPVSVSESNGDVQLVVPFQKQLPQADMAEDKTQERVLYTVILRMYGTKTLRLYCDFNSPCQDVRNANAIECRSDKTAGKEAAAMSDESEMLQLEEATTCHSPLTVEKKEDGWHITTLDGVERAFVNTKEKPLKRWSDLQPDPQETLDLRLFPDGEHEIRLASYDHFSPPRYDALPLAMVKKQDKPQAATISMEAKMDECFAGTGERFRKMDLSGQTFFLKNQDGQGVNNSRCYKNIPFYVSSRMYGAFFHTSHYVKLSLAGHSTRSTEWLNYDAKIDVFFIADRTMDGILRGYRSLTGFPSMPPLWSFGVWMSRMTYFSAKEVEDICQRLRREDYPCDVIHLDTGWFKTDWLCEWKFNEQRFPQPEEFLKRLRENGFRVSLWQLPYVAKGAEQEQEAKQNRYIAPLRHKQEREGSNFSALDYEGTIDFSSKKATEWYKSLLRRLLKMGVVCIKTDFGENIHMDADYETMSAEELNNLYALLYQKAAYEVTREVTGEGIVWARAAWAGCQRYPLHWGGDSASTWEGLAGSLRGGLHFAMSGFAFWSHDVPGFHSLPNFMNTRVEDDIYVRWTQFGVFSSHIRYHGTSEREPWCYPKIAPIVRRWWKLRYRLIPYIVEESQKAISSGGAMVMPLIYQCAGDPVVWHIDDEYFFGTKMLCAPVMNAEGRRNIYLPEGEWVNFFTKECFTGPLWLRDQVVPLDEMPVFVRKGETIEMYPQDVRSTDEMQLDKAVKVRF